MGVENGGWLLMGTFSCGNDEYNLKLDCGNGYTQVCEYSKHN